VKPDMGKNIETTIERLIDNCKQVSIKGFDYADSLKQWHELMKIKRFHPHTREIEIKSVCDFIEFRYRSLGLTDSPLHWKLAQLEAFCEARKFSTSTTNIKFRSIRSYIRWAFEKGIVDGDNEMLFMKPPKVYRKRRLALTEMQLRTIWESLYSPSYYELAPKSVSRERVVFELLTSWAPRQAEMLKIRWSEINLEKGLIEFTQKGGRPRIISITPSLQSAMLAWRALANPDAIYMLSYRKSKPHGWNTFLHPFSLASIMKRWRKLIDFPEDEYFGCHLFRHTLATRSYLQNMNVETARKLMGHKDIATTMKYIHVPDSDIASLAENLSLKFRGFQVKKGGKEP